MSAVPDVKCSLCPLGGATSDATFSAVGNRTPGSCVTAKQSNHWTTTPSLYNILHSIWIELRNNVYRTLMRIKRVHGHSISGEYVNNCIDGFGATQRKLTASLRGRLCMSTNTIIAPYVSSLYFMFASPLCEKWNRPLLLCDRLEKRELSLPCKQQF